MIKKWNPLESFLIENYTDYYQLTQVEKNIDAAIKALISEIEVELPKEKWWKDGLEVFKVSEGLSISNKKWKVKNKGEAVEIGIWDIRLDYALTEQYIPISGIWFESKESLQIFSNRFESKFSNLKPKLKLIPNQNYYHKELYFVLEPLIELSNIPSVFKDLDLLKNTILERFELYSEYIPKLDEVFNVINRK